MRPEQFKQMNILYPCDITTAEPTNPYTWQLANAVNSHSAIQHVQFGAATFFWQNSYDVVHFQWPEAIFGFREPTQEQLKLARQRLEQHRATARIVTTVHNYKPHKEFNNLGRDVFDAVYSKTDDFIHLGKASKEAFLSAYGGESWCKTARHHIVCHGDYQYYRTLDRDCSIADIAKGNAGERVMLVFGALRNSKEKQLSIEAFKKANINNQRLVFAGKLSNAVKKRKKKWEKFRLFGPNKRDPRIKFIHNRIKNSQVAPLLETSDFIFIPRHGRLNSGVIPLALTFGLPVVGPNEGVIGEMLQETGNYTYAPGDSDAAAEAIRTLTSLDEKLRIHLAEQGEAYRKENMSWSKITEKHIKIYGMD